MSDDTPPASTSTGSTGESTTQLSPRKSPNAEESLQQGPIRKIILNRDINKWVLTMAYADVVAFLKLVNESVESKSIPQISEGNSLPFAPESAMGRLMELIQGTKNLVESVPLDTTSSRFGNIAFRDLGKVLSGKFPELISPIQQLCKFPDPEKKDEYLLELKTYFCECLGNPVRIDYGTGHELSFILFLTCLWKLEVFSQKDFPNLACFVFNSYLSLVRYTQSKFKLEPAGSRGVWGIDDFQFIPFYWGSSQLIDHEYLFPKSIFNEEFREEHGDEFLYFAAIQHIYNSKTGPFFEHSPILTDVATSCPHWKKINGGMWKMYRAEVLEKRVVVQHLKFGNLLPFQPTPNNIEAWNLLLMEEEEHADLDIITTAAGQISVPTGPGKTNPSMTTTVPHPQKK